VDTLVDRQAEDVVLLDLTGLATWADHFIIATVDNVRQANAIIAALQETVSAHGARAFHPEGEPASGWVLIDVGNGAIVHLFTAETRAYYNLEGLWNRAQEVVRIQ
jgi:ribosome-associated protein